MSARNDAVSDYWTRYYSDGVCTICGQRGWFDTRGTKSPTGQEVGRLQYCICPNGQVLRDAKFPLTGERPPAGPAH